MKLAVIGTGYVGLVSGACFSEFGFDVTCIDKDAGKIDSIRSGVMPIYELGLEDLAARSHRHGRFHDNDGIAGQVAGKLARGVEHIGQVGMPVPAPGGRSDRDEHRIRTGNSRSEFGREMQPAGRDVACYKVCLLYTSPSPRDKRQSRMPSSA